MLQACHVQPGARVAVAVSGGIDSVCLLHALFALQQSYPLQLSVLNFEHGIRGEDSVRDSVFVKELAEKYGLPLFFYEINVPAEAASRGKGIEQTARELRYEHIDRLLGEGTVDFVATAHNSDDNAESILMHLLRGAGTNGVQGIPLCRGKIIRPLIHVSRKEIETYAHENGLCFVHDETNDDVNYTRNFIRKQVLPLLETRYPNVKNALSGFGERIASAQAYLTEQAKKEVTQMGEQAYAFSVDLHPALFSECIFYIASLLGAVNNLEQAHINGIRSLIEAQTGKSVQLTNGLVAWKEYGSIVLEKKRCPDPLLAPFSLHSLSVNRGIIQVEQTLTADLSCKNKWFFDLKKLPQNAIWRNPQNNDRFTPCNSKDKLLSDYFTDRKISARLRSEFPVLACGSRVYLVVGFGVADQVKIDSSSSQIVCVNLS